MIVPVIMAGGVGSRLWPVSRALLPKQFIQFPRQQGSLFQNTLKRLQGLPDLGNPIVVCNEDHRFLAAEQLRQAGLRGNVVLEPRGRNTAPVVAMAALIATHQDPEAVLLILAADHAIGDNAALHDAINCGNALARQNYLVTFGSVPTAPETGYGYIKSGKPIDDASGKNLGNAVDSFVEKPDAETARRYLDSGEYLWNSGNFVIKATTYLTELARYAPDIDQVCRQAFEGLEQDHDFSRIPADIFNRCRADSIDYAVMEKTNRAAVVALQTLWSDVGAWHALWDLASKDNEGNVLEGDVLTTEVTNSYIHAGSRLVAAVGLSDAIVVETADAVLVADRGKAQQVKKIVELLESMERREVISHALVHRPWGSYESLVNQDGYQVKHIIVNPGAALSLQLHHKRAEHWTVIKGEARVTRNDDVFMLKQNESTFIPLGSKHRLENPGNDPVEVIEVQVGDYLGEDDIVRFEDVYGRVVEGA
ncbi:MAG: mannose-1-phosphate guanylyltransferase/mannose-6-phosphate isomerase [Pseudohongiellaceae bacterium]